MIRLFATTAPGPASAPAAPPGSSAVEVHGVSHSFEAGENGKQVLCDVHLEAPPGRIIILTGPSGSGKTTLLTLIGTLRSVQRGSVRTLGRELAGLSAGERVRVRRQIGFIFQAHNLFGALTAHQNVRMALELCGRPGPEMDKKAAAMLQRLGLGDHLHHRPDALSGGQRQRVAVARAVVHGPRLVLADEPTAALDKDSGRDVIDLFRQLARGEGCTILLVTHDHRLFDAADRVIHLVDGRIVSDRPGD